MHRSVSFGRAISLLVLALSFLSARAAQLDGEVLDLLKRRPVQNARVLITPRQITFDEFGRATLIPWSQNDAGIETSTDANGKFSVNAQEGFVAVRVTRDGFAEFFNALVKTDAGKVNSLIVELVSAEPTDEELAILEQRRIEAQLIERFREEQEAPPERAQAIATAQPVVPANVWVVDLEGYTGFINLDEFISGVVSREMGDGFPYEALKAQAVAARTYALARLRDRGQANGGQAYTSTLGSRSSAAAFNSSGVALTYNSSYISAFFSARCNGDFTLDSEDGLSGLTTCTVGGLVGGRVIPYLRKVACSGHVNCSQTAEACCHVTVDGRAQHIYGHGVGLCQRGAQNFAGRDGMNWQQIINRFYTTVVTLPGQQIRLGDRFEMIAVANRRTAACGGTATSVGQGSTGTIIAGPERIACTLISGTSYVTWWRVAFDNGARGWVAEDYLKKAPSTQTLPDIRLSITAAAAGSASIVANGRANLRVALEESQNFTSWTPIVTNAFSTAGATTFTRPLTASERKYRARLLLPDTAP